jgi:hypothetical protein
VEDDFEKLLREEGSDGQADGSSSSRKTKMVIYLVAGGFLLVGVLNLGVYLFKNHHDHTSASIWRCLYLSIPLVIGAAILIKSPALAERIDEWLDE